MSSPAPETNATATTTSSPAVVKPAATTSTRRNVGGEFNSGEGIEALRVLTDCSGDKRSARRLNPKENPCLEDGEDVRTTSQAS